MDNKNHDISKLSYSPLINRPRRLRQSEGLRSMIRETEINVGDFIYPLFIRHGEGRTPIRSMPGVYQLSVQDAIRETESARKLGLKAVILFGIPDKKDPIGFENFSEDGIVQQAIRSIKKEFPEMVVISDVCMCEYTDHGHCGILNTGEHYRKSLPEGYLLNDPTLDVLCKVAVSHANAGADIVAPSGMMDGMVKAIREGLDEEDFENIPILSYAVKYASSFYGPFREAAEGAPKFGDRRSHQMDPANFREALREAALDLSEGADLIMVKPALAFLDVISKVKDAFPEVPMVAYNVSGEYALIKAAAANGWVDETSITLETLTSMKRAGADLIISYHALDVARWLK